MARIGTVTKRFKRSNNGWDPSKKTLRLDKLQIRMAVYISMAEI
nr:107_t:CDS:2 [Entrophospora candida]